MIKNKLLIFMLGIIGTAPLMAMEKSPEAQHQDKRRKYQALSIVLREMVRKVPELKINSDNAYHDYAYRLEYFTQHHEQIQSISSFIQATRIDPSDINAIPIRNKKLGGYLNEIAAKQDHPATLKWLANNIYPKPQDRFIQRLFSEALSANKFEDARLFLANGANIDMQDALGITPLMRRAADAWGTGRFEQLVFLLEHGANPKLCDNSGKTVLEYAYEGRNQKKIDLLLEYISGKMSVTHYTTMGTTRTASAAEIKKAYRKLALKYHPDRATQNGYTKEEAHKLFIELKDAYNILSDPEKRKNYDGSLFKKMN